MCCNKEENELCFLKIEFFLGLISNPVSSAIDHLWVLLTVGTGWEEFTAILDGESGRVLFTGLFVN